MLGRPGLQRAWVALEPFRRWGRLAREVASYTVYVMESSFIWERGELLR